MYAKNINALHYTIHIFVNNSGLINLVDMNQHEELIHTFYSAFKERNFRVMQESYADNATFSDPVFQDLKAEQVRAMWEMFLTKSDSLTVDFGNVELVGEMVTASWTARYTLSSTGRPVENNIRAIFKIKNGKILRHTDSFNFYSWTRQALGLKGTLLGWTPLVKNKIRRTAMTSLLTFMRRKN